MKEDQARVDVVQRAVDAIRCDVCRRAPNEREREQLVIFAERHRWQIQTGQGIDWQCPACARIH